MGKSEWQHLKPGKSRWLDPFDGVRERRSRGTRKPLDFQYNFREYLFASLIPWGLFWVGADLFGKHPFWQNAVGVVLMLAGLGLVAWFVRWLMRPIDEAALRSQREYHESMKWSNIAKEWRESRQRKKSKLS